MGERRALVDGLTDIEADFIYGKNPKPERKTQPPAPATAAHTTETRGGKGLSVSRVPITSRIRTDYAEGIKRASLERQLNKVFPNTLQDILEEALEPWLRTNGYLK